MRLFFKQKRGAALLMSLLLLVTFMGTTACSLRSSRVQAADLMKGVTSKNVSGKDADNTFVAAMSDFYLDLFQKTMDDNKNSLVSPLSVMLALTMTANGADRETLTQMEAVLGRGISLAELNRYLLAYASNLPADSKYRINIANSIWFRDDENRLHVEEEFLQKNADYFKAQAYKSPFNDQTLQDINNWVEEKTEGMIDKILDEIREDAVMYLINALVFEAEWENIYKTHQIEPGQFRGEDSKTYDVEFMNSEESIYLENESAIGFIKPYAGNQYSFVALLPRQGMSVQDFVAGLSGEKLLHLLQSASHEDVQATLPKFSYEYEVVMNDALKALGMPDAFSPPAANFSKLGQSSRGNIFIGEVLHKTFIVVDEKGTKAGAVTKVEMRDEAYRETKIVRLDRPFVYAIIDNATNLPIFLGTVMDFQ
jgi:serine protease inhibitor